MNPAKTTCPACGREIEGTQDVISNCPGCGASLAGTTTHRINWWIFFAALLTPPILTLLASLAKIEAAATGIPFLGGGIAGLICGIMLGRRIGKSTTARVLLSILFVAVLGSLTFFLSFMGCMAGGFQMNFH